VEELFKTYAGHVALFVEAIAAIVITIGAVQAAVALLIPARRGIAHRIIARKKFGLASACGYCLALSSNSQRI